MALDDRLFIALRSGAVTARDLQGGREIWTAPVVADGPLAAAEQRVLVPTAENIQALDAATGRQVWAIRVGTITAPLLVKDGWLLVAVAEQLSAYRLADGTLVWSRDIGAVEQRPAIEGPKLYVPVADGRLVALDLKSGEPLWERDVGVAPTEPLAFSDRVFVGSGAKRFYALKADDGAEDWVLRVGAAVRGAAVADGSHVYFVALDNLLRAHDRGNGALRWKVDLRFRPLGGPQLVAGAVTVPGMTREIRAFESGSGRQAHRLLFANTLATQPTLIAASETRSALVAALTGSLQNEWQLTLAGAPPPGPSPIPVEPLTALPGLVRLLDSG